MCPGSAGGSAAHQAVSTGGKPTDEGKWSSHIIWHLLGYVWILASSLRPSGQQCCWYSGVISARGDRDGWAGAIVWWAEVEGPGLVQPGAGLASVGLTSTEMKPESGQWRMREGHKPNLEGFQTDIRRCFQLQGIETGCAERPGPLQLWQSWWGSEQPDLLLDFHIWSKSTLSSLPNWITLSFGNPNQTENTVG